MAECPAEDCLFIDDLPANVEGARAFGWQSIQYTTDHDLLQQLCNSGVVI